MLSYRQNILGTNYEISIESLEIKVWKKLSFVKNSVLVFKICKKKRSFCQVASWFHVDEKQTNFILLLSCVSVEITLKRYSRMFTDQVSAPRFQSIIES